MNETNFETQKVNNEKDIIDFYDNYAQDWDLRFGDARSNSIHYEDRWNSFNALIQEYHGTHALELGVGTGVYIERLSKIFNKIIAVDGSEKMLKVLQEKLERGNIQNVKVYNSDVLDMRDIDDESIDIIYFFGLIEHIIHIDVFMKEIYRILRKGGVVVGVTPNGLSPWFSIRKFVRSTGKHCDSDRYYTLKSLNDTFHRYGFVLKDYRYWGILPAGINSGIIINSLKMLEKISIHTPLKMLYGCFTFNFKKPLS